MNRETKKNSISIIPPGQQLKEKLIQHFGDLKNAALHLGLSKNTLEQYLRSSELGSDSFKIKLTQLYDADFDSLYLSITDQISAYINEAYERFDIFPGNELTQLEELKQAASKYSLLKEYDYIVFLLGVQQSREGLLKESFKNLCKAYILFEEHQNITMKLTTALYLVRMNTICAHQYYEEAVPDYVLDSLKKVHLISNAYSKQMTYLILLKLMIPKVKSQYEHVIIEEHRLIFLYFAIIGYAHIALEEYEASIKYNNSALLHAADNRLLPVFVNLGAAYHYSGFPDKAFENYSKALSIIDEEDPRIYHIFINIWELLRTTGDINMANAYWEMIDLDKYFEVKYGYFHYFEKMIKYGIEKNDEDFILKAFSVASEKFSKNIYTLNDTPKLMTHVGDLIEANEFTTGLLEKTKASLTNFFLSHPNLTESIKDAIFRLLGILHFKIHDDFKN